MAKLDHIFIKDIHFWCKTFYRGSSIPLSEVFHWLIAPTLKIFPVQLCLASVSSHSSLCLCLSRSCLPLKNLLMYRCLQMKALLPLGKQFSKSNRNFQSSLKEGKQNWKHHFVFNSFQLQGSEKERRSAGFVLSICYIYTEHGRDGENFLIFLKPWLWVEMKSLKQYSFWLPHRCHPFQRSTTWGFFILSISLLSQAVIPTAAAMNAAIN